MQNHNPCRTILEQITNVGVSDVLLKKAEILTDLACSYPSALVAYSGGVDSTFLAYWVFCCLGERMQAVTVRSSIESPDQLEFAEQTARQLRIPQMQLEYDSLLNPLIRSNPVDRCFHCKLSILTLIGEYAHNHGYAVIMEGQNVDDLGDYRPGREAVRQSGTLSPLMECGFTKSDIRLLSRILGLPTWNIPSSPCLATRIPYGLPLDRGKLVQIDAGERYLRGRGFQQVRIRWTPGKCSVEVGENEIAKYRVEEAEIKKTLQEIGLPEAEVDPRGYRQGSLNEGITK